MVILILVLVDGVRDVSHDTATPSSTNVTENDNLVTFRSDYPFHVADDTSYSKCTFISFSPKKAKLKIKLPHYRIIP